MIAKTLDLPNWFTRSRESSRDEQAEPAKNQRLWLSRWVPSKASNDEIPELFPYSLRDPLLPPVETMFYQVLHAVVGKRVVVCPKMRLADVFRVKPGKDNETFYKRIEARSVDFVLCERYTLKPLLAIELYDHSQAKSVRKHRDPWMDKVFQAAKLPILHLVAQAQYNPKALALRVAPYLTTVVYQRGSVTPPEYALAPRCKCCHKPMVKRAVISGDYKGREYFACQNYPACCERLPLTRAIAYVN